MQSIVPTVFRTGDPTIDRNLDQIYQTFRRLSELVGRTVDTVEDEIPAPDDHLVKSSTTDATVVGGLVEKTEAAGGISLTEVTTAGQKKLRIYAPPAPSVPVASTTLPLPDGVAALGNEGKWADGKHVHPRQTNAPVVAFCGAEVALYGWTQGPTGTWTKDVAGPVTGTGWADEAALATGDRIFLCDRVPGMAVVYDVQAGPYDLLNAGAPGVQAVIRRSTDADEDAEFFAGMSILVVSGTDWGGKTLTLVTPSVDVDVTEQRWAVGATSGAAATVTWDRIVPTGQAVYPMPALTIAAGGKLTLGEGNMFTVNPDGLDLNMISVASCPAYTTVPITLLFTAALKLQHAQTPSAGFASLYLHRAGSVNNPLALKYPYSSAQFALVGGEWVLLSFHSSQ